MVQVYQEPLCRRHFASVLSSAALLRVAAFLAAVVLSFLLAYASGGFWQKVAQDVTQPIVHFSGDSLMVLESTVPGQEQVWSSAPAVAAVLTANNRLSVAVQVGEEDWDQDGKPDLIHFVARAQSRVPVHSVKLLLQFSYTIKGAAYLKMHSLAYIHAASPLPGSTLSADGQLLLQQAMPLRAGSALLRLDKPLLDSGELQDGSAVQADALLHLGDLLSRYQSRNVTTVFEAPHSVWTGGSSQEFTVDARVRVPRHQVFVYRPGLLSMLKWGWVQFLATFLLVHWLLSLLEGLLFRQSVLQTRVISDVQPRGGGPRY